MTMFLTGSYENKLDKKGRVSVPKLYRTALAHDNFAGVYVYKAAQQPCLEACGYEYMKMISESLKQMDQTSKEYNTLMAIYFQASVTLPYDPEGRITLPQAFIEYANLTDTVVFSGRSHQMQIWEPQAYRAYMDGILKEAEAGIPSLYLDQGDKG